MWVWNTDCQSGVIGRGLLQTMFTRLTISRKEIGSARSREVTGSLCHCLENKYRRLEDTKLFYVTGFLTANNFQRSKQENTISTESQHTYWLVELPAFQKSYLTYNMML